MMSQHFIFHAHLHTLVHVIRNGQLQSIRNGQQKFWLNTSRPIWYGRHFVDDMLVGICNEISVFIKISPKFIPDDQWWMR